MAVVMCCAWDKWLGWNKMTAPTYLSRPSDYSKHLRLNVISWLVQDKIDPNSITTGESNTPGDSPIVSSPTDSHCKEPASAFEDTCDTNHNSSEDETLTLMDTMKRHITSMLPTNYEYKFYEIDSNKSDANTFTCSFRIKLANEGDARNWVKQYNSVTKQTMVFERNNKKAGKRVLRKLCLRC